MGCFVLLLVEGNYLLIPLVLWLKIVRVEQCCSMNMMYIRADSYVQVTLCLIHPCANNSQMVEMQESHPYISNCRREARRR